MERYFEQLLEDIRESIEEFKLTDEGKTYELWEFLSEEEEEMTAPIRNVQDWTGISQEILPPSELLTKEQLHLLLKELMKLLDACNCHFVLQFDVPEDLQYETIRNNFDQEVKIKTFHMSFFEFCKPGIPHKSCSLKDYCHCSFFKELFADMIDEDLSPEEERARYLEIEIRHLKRKYEDDWMRYYPYHLDPEYDDEYGNPYDYGFGEDEEDEDDTWWRR